MSRSLHLFSGLLLSTVLAASVGTLTYCGGKTTSNADGGGDMGNEVEVNLCNGTGCIGAPVPGHGCTEGTGSAPLLDDHPPQQPPSWCRPRRLLHA